MPATSHGLAHRKSAPLTHPSARIVACRPNPCCCAKRTRRQKPPGFSACRCRRCTTGWRRANTAGAATRRPFAKLRAGPAGRGRSPGPSSSRPALYGSTAATFAFRWRNCARHRDPLRSVRRAVPTRTLEALRSQDRRRDLAGSTDLRSRDRRSRRPATEPNHCAGVLRRLVTTPGLGIRNTYSHGPRDALVRARRI